MGNVKFMSVLAGALAGTALVLLFFPQMEDSFVQTLALLAVAFAVLSLHEK